MKIGIGYDVHRLVSGRALILGGVQIPFPKGLQGHSDADVLTHAIIDALLGAANLGDIGMLFPDTQARYKDISSQVLLELVGRKLKEKNYAIVNIDSVVVCQEPKLKDYKQQMIDTLSETLSISPQCLSIKATTTEQLGFEGRGEGISAQAVVLLEEEKSDSVIGIDKKI